MAEKMNQFSYEHELANYLMSSDPLQNSWAAILELYRQTHQNDPSLPVSVTYKRYSGQNHPPNVTVIAFCCSPICTIQHLQGDGKDLVSSATLKENLNFPLFDFLSTEVNPSFSIHKAAIQLYGSIHGQLCQEKIDVTKPLIITGHSLGGSVATLFTLWLLGCIYSEMGRNTKRPICLTFGSPLLGDDGFQRAILNRPTWNSCFMNLVSKQDSIPSFFISPYNTQTSSPYKPFGLFLFYSESGVACFSEPESILELLGLMRSESLQAVDYGRVLECLKHKAICRGSQLGGWDNNPFQTGITLQLQAIGVDGMQPQQQNNELTTKIEEKQKNSLVWKTNSLDSDKKLNDMKINMAYLEWYKKVTRSRGGYYDSYKSAWSRAREEIRSKEQIVKHQGILTRYWKQMVAEAKKTEGASFPFRYLMAGNNYRRMVEPLDIAEYYKQGKKDYWGLGRSEHYKLLKKWLDDRPKKGNQRNKACSFNEDSCFWAHVEEALISVGMLKDGESRPEEGELLGNLNKFEEYVMESIHNRLVDPEIFLEGSSFMTWWNIYKGRKGSEYNSPLANFMMNKSYHSYS